MTRISFVKMVAAGNDFIVIKLPLSSGVALNKLARSMCNRKYGVGADGVLFMQRSSAADTRMRIFNPDGSEAESCGNGLRCLARYYQDLKSRPRGELSIETRAGLVQAKTNGDSVRIRLTDPRNIRLDIPLKVERRKLKVNFINTGVPHVVIFVEGLSGLDPLRIGRIIRYHRSFAPRGTNVNFAEVMNKDSIRLRTYERGVEDETLACGTGSAASALIFALKTNAVGRINVHTQSGEILKISFVRSRGAITDVWLEGKARRLFSGEFLYQSQGGLYV